MQGLSVTLRPYQRQSLQFMLDAEETEAGFRDHLYVQLTNSKGQHYWYSPILRRICREVAPMAYGGFLGESHKLSLDYVALTLTLVLHSQCGPQAMQLLHAVCVADCMGICHHACLLL